MNYEETIEAARVLGLGEKDQYRVVDFHTIPKNKEGKYTKEQLREVEMIEGELITLLPEEHIYRNMNQIVMIQKVDSRQKDLDYDAQMTEIQQVVQKNIMERKKNITAWICSHIRPEVVCTLVTGEATLFQMYGAVISCCAANT